MRYLTVFGKPVMAVGKKRMSDWALMDLLAGIRYKPGWSIHLSCTKGNWAKIGIRAYDQVDTNNWSKRVTFGNNPWVYLCQSPDKIVSDIRYHLGEMDSHERDEFLIVNGVRRFDPHAKKQKTEEESEREFTKWNT